jgi:hypothetical protein
LRGAMFTMSAVMDTEMTALTAAPAMATVIIDENLSRMMVPFCLAVCYWNGIPS